MSDTNTSGGSATQRPQTPDNSTTASGNGGHDDSPYNADSELSPRSPVRHSEPAYLQMFKRAADDQRDTTGSSNADSTANLYDRNQVGSGTGFVWSDDDKNANK